MAPVKRDRRPKSSPDSSSLPDPALPPGEAPNNTSPLRIDERCPERYYPLFPLVARRRTPIRYYE